MAHGEGTGCAGVGSVFRGGGVERVAAIAVLVCLCGVGFSADRAPLTPAEVASRFARQKRAQMNAIADRSGIAVNPEFEKLFTAVEQNDWLAASNVWVSLRSRAGQYEDSRDDPIVRNALWQPALETYGFFEQVHLWHPDLMAAYARDVLGSIPDGSVYFGGTDPGRFVITAYRDVQGAPDVIVITQNALADNLYMSYVREQFGARIWIPSREDSAEAFRQYVEEVKAGKRPQNAQLQVRNGRVTVSGALGVMEINGILAQHIFEKNQSQHGFYLDESYVIPWMYPYLEPHGLIMKLNPQRVRLAPEKIEADGVFWSEQMRALLADPRFLDNEAARKTYSKLRGAIAGLYAKRGYFKEAEAAFEEARRLDPASPEANYRYAQEVLLPHRRYADARRVIMALKRAAPEDAKADTFLASLDKLERTQGRIEELDRLRADGRIGVDQTLELAELYAETGQQARSIALTSAILKAKDLPASVLLRLAKLLHRAKQYEQMCSALDRLIADLPPDTPADTLLGIVPLYISAKRFEGAIACMGKYLEREPADWKAWIDLAILDISAGSTRDAEAALVSAITSGGDDARKVIRKDTRFAPLLKAPSVAEKL